MLSKSDKKYIKSLSVKKNRDRERLFVVEGEKSVNEFLSSSFNIKAVYCTNECETSFVNSIAISHSEMQQISALKTPSPVIAIAEIPNAKINNFDICNELVLALEDVQDPGNLGTIIRIADWFGIKHIICSLHTADAYSNKTVQASMGSLTRLNIVYTDLISFLKEIDNPVYGTFLEGTNIYSSNLSYAGVIVMGNEGKGISKEVEKFVSEKLYIPPFGNSKTESLNVAAATAIVCSEFRRKI